MLRRLLFLFSVAFVESLIGVCPVRGFMPLVSVNKLCVGSAHRVRPAISHLVCGTGSDSNPDPHSEDDSTDVKSEKFLGSRRLAAVKVVRYALQNPCFAACACDAMMLMLFTGYHE